MNLLASVLFASLAVAAVEVGCSSDDNGSSPLTPFDAGKVTVPEAGAGAGPVTINVNGNGTVQSNDSTTNDAGVTVGGTVNCQSGGKGACSAPQGSLIYAVPATGSQFVGWYANGDGGLVLLQSSTTSYVITAGTANPLTAVFAINANGPDATPPPAPVVDAATGG